MGLDGEALFMYFIACGGCRPTGERVWGRRESGRGEHGLHGYERAK